MHSDLVPYSYKQFDKTVGGVCTCSIVGVAFLCDEPYFHLTRASTFVSVFMHSSLTLGKPLGTHNFCFSVLSLSLSFQV